MQGLRSLILRFMVQPEPLRVKKMVALITARAEERTGADSVGGSRPWRLSRPQTRRWSPDGSALDGTAVRWTEPAGAPSAALWGWDFQLFDFPWWLSGKESSCRYRRLSSGRYPGGGNGSPLQYSCLGNPMDRGAWQATAHGVAKSQTQFIN